LEKKPRTRRVYFSPEFYAQLKEHADRLGQSVDDYVNGLIKLGLSDAKRRT
jgi:hypothetical protein